MKRITQVLALITFIGTLYVNYLSNTGEINNETMASVSRQYFTLFTPAGYAFSIWGMIYLGQALFLIKMCADIFKTNDENELPQKFGFYFIAINLLNTIWVFMWLNHYTGLSVIVMFLLLICLLAILFIEQINTSKAPLKQYIFVRWPFSLYLGWIIAASIANTAAYLIKIGYSGAPLSMTIWTYVMIAVALIVYLFMLWKRNTDVLALVGIWALVAIGVARYHQVDEISWFAFACAIILFVNIAVHRYKINKNKASVRARSDH
ncbi:tryptophan-rich sensory protein [Salibacter halophilus]|uniref:Tryptophan-rich sensory protein n=1 Tax=Salibacter halophilus TaxID=1803916 RepID=A0A6N6M6U7_9FLAO|nr:tryptophan-rich sensory protein [Salibacter halophilus]KAB1065634.1 tryptophan-rich sensory protein [Salibacter halophilus]